MTIPVPCASAKPMEANNNAPTVCQPGLGGAGQPRQPGKMIKYMEGLPAHFQQLKQLLNHKSYQGSKNSGQWTLERLEQEWQELKKVQQAGGYLLSDLVDTMQATEDEILEGLKRCEAVRENGMWYSLNKDYPMKVVCFIFRFFVESSWALDSVKRDETMAAILEMPEMVNDEEVCRQIFSMFCTPVGGEDPEEYEVVRERVSRFYGSHLLASKTSTAFSLTEFLNKWAELVPEGITMNLPDLDGLCLVEDVEDVEEDEDVENVQEENSDLTYICLATAGIL